MQEGDGEAVTVMDVRDQAGEAVVCVEVGQEADVGEGVAEGLWVLVSDGI